MNHIRSRITRSFLSVAMATALLTGGALTGVVPAALAQDQPAAAPGGPAPGGGAHGNRMGKILMSLDLTDAQKTQIRAIIADARKQNKDVADRDQKRANMKAAYAKVDAVLTPAQRTELHAKLDAMRAQDQTTHTQ